MKTAINTSNSKKLLAWMKSPDETWKDSAIKLNSKKIIVEHKSEEKLLGKIIGNAMNDK